jgi:hypothetical protein
MALEQEIDGSSQAESGKQEKQNQVHRALWIKQKPAKKRQLVRGKGCKANYSGSANPS